MPPEMIVNSAVEIVKRKYNQYDAGFTNQLLRKAVKLRLEVKELDYNINLLPPKLRSYWKDIYKKEKLKSLVDIIAQPTESYVSTSSIINDDALGSPIDVEWVKGHYFQQILNFSKWKESDFFHKTYIQDPSTFLSINLLNPQPKEKIADLCAAPGGKARLIAEKIGNEGSLLCVDSSETRVNRLKENLKSFNNIQIEVADACKIKDCSFDAILLDAPCSNTGIFRRKPDAMWNFSIDKMKELIVIQKALLENAAPLLRKGGRLVYSTCSIDNQENQKQVYDFLKNNTSFKLEQEVTLMPNSSHNGAYSALLIRKS